MVKKLVKPETNEKNYNDVVPFSEGCSGHRGYADEEIEDITF